jgi:hypothetical protein
MQKSSGIPIPLRSTRCPKKGAPVSKRRKPKGVKTTLDSPAIMDLDLNQFLFDLIRDRSLFGVLNGLVEACRSRADSFASDLEKEGVHPSVKALIEDEVEFFEGAAKNIELAIRVLKNDWEGRDMPSCADGTFRPMTRRSADAAQYHLEMLIGIVNDPEATLEERNNAATKLAREGHTIWWNRDTGEPNFELAKAFAEATAKLIDPNVSEAERREAAADLQQFIFTNGERREETGE